MKFVFFGTPQPARAILEALQLQGLTPLACVTQPDRPVKRSSKLVPSPVKEWALQNNCAVLQPTSPRDPAFLQELSQLKVDCFVVVAYGGFLPQELLDMPRYGCINVHPSLLPLYRGAAPLVWPLIHGDLKSGVTIMEMVKKMDAGPILLQEEFSIEHFQTRLELEEFAWPLAAKMLISVLGKIQEEGCLRGVPQNDDLATFAPKLTPDLGCIDWRCSAREIYNLVRGLSPAPAAYGKLSINGSSKRVKVLRASVLSSQQEGTSGDVFESEKGELGVICGDGQGLVIHEMQVEGKKSMPSKQFLNGCSLQILNFC